MQDTITSSNSEQPITHYVLGFPFDPTVATVALLRKRRPDWQAGKLNGYGGHVEIGEDAAQAMAREFLKESGVALTEVHGMRRIACYDGPGWKLSVFGMWVPNNELRDITDELHEVVALAEIAAGFGQFVECVDWMVPLCLHALRAPGNVIANLRYSEK